jgi:cytochrome c biogenesis protein CcmG, thiol:disulfide interchange protein DsbE
MRKTILLISMLSIAACNREAAAPAAKAANSAPPAAEAPAGTELAVGSTMPAYKAAMIGGGTFDVGAERGNVVLLNVWATWCGPCRYEIPALQKLHQKYGGRGFKVVGISIDEGEAQPVKQFVTEHKMDYPVALDPDGKLANIFQTSVIPTSVLIDRNGKVIWKKYGAIDENELPLTRAIEAAL